MDEANEKGNDAGGAGTAEGRPFVLAWRHVSGRDREDAV